MRIKCLAVFIISANLLFGCGGGGGGAPFELDSHIGSYDTTARITKRSGSCAVSPDSIEQILGSGAALAQSGEGEVEIFLPGSFQLLGTVAGDVITTEGGFALGGEGAGHIAAVWEFNGESFDASYVYSEGFLNGASDCLLELEGTAVQFG